jgi:hypothetical protein
MKSMPLSAPEAGAPRIVRLPHTFAWAAGWAAIGWAVRESLRSFFIDCTKV